MLTRRIPWLALRAAGAAMCLAACAGGAAGGDGGWLELKTAGTGPTMQISGTVRHLDLEGGVFVIRDAQGTQYNPMNLPKEFQVDGTPVEAEARRRDDMASIAMVGPLVEIVRIRRATPAGLAGTSWRLGELGGAPSSVEATLEFGQDGSVSGNASCNRFRGPVTVQPDGALTFGALAATRMFCAGDAVMRQETAYLAALGKVERFAISGDSLTLSAAGAPLLRFVRTGGSGQ